MTSIALHPDADTELAEAAQYYESRQLGLGLNLLGEAEVFLLAKTAEEHEMMHRRNVLRFVR
jgi:hypothetical protein